MKAVKCRETASKHFDMNNIEVRRSSLAGWRRYGMSSAEMPPLAASSFCDMSNIEVRRSRLAGWRLYAMSRLEIRLGRIESLRYE